MSNDSSIEAQGFISYTRLDNEDFANVVDKLKRQLEGRFHAATGRRLRIFLDRDSIGWGNDWRGRIRESVRSATFFIPIVTMRYFESDACREELLAFHENAKQLGVTELILPIVLSGADGISPDDSREEVRLIETLNYKNIEESWLSGYESAEWLRAVHSMVDGLKKSLAQAESALTAQEAATADIAENEEEQESTAGADLMALGEDINGLTEVTNKVTEAMSAFGEAAKEGSGGADLSSLLPKQQQAALVRMAHALKSPAENLSTVGGEFEKHVVSTDARLRAVIDEMRTIDAEVAEQNLEKLLNAFSGMNELSAIVGQMEAFVQTLRFAAITNVSLRKSVQPAIKGIQSIGNGVATVESWRAI